MNAMQLLNAIRNGGNPQALFNQIAQGNPQMAQVLNSLKGKSNDEMRQYAENLAKERNVNLEQLINNLGLNNKK